MKAPPNAGAAVPALPALGGSAPPARRNKKSAWDRRPGGIRALTTAEAVDALQRLALDPKLPPHRQRIIRALADAIADGKLNGGDSDGSGE